MIRATILCSICRDLSVTLHCSWETVWDTWWRPVHLTLQQPSSFPPRTPFILAETLGHFLPVHSFVKSTGELIRLSLQVADKTDNLRHHTATTQPEAYIVDVAGSCNFFISSSTSIEGLKKTAASGVLCSVFSSMAFKAPDVLGHKDGLSSSRPVLPYSLAMAIIHCPRIHRPVTCQAHC